jgi:hypothetical protein
VAKLGKPTIIFLRHRSGPVFLGYEIVGPCYLHQHIGALTVNRIDNRDIVVDAQDKLAWRLRSLAPGIHLITLDCRTEGRIPPSFEPVDQFFFRLRIMPPVPVPDFHGCLCLRAHKGHASMRGSGKMRRDVDHESGKAKPS